MEDFSAVFDYDSNTYDGKDFGYLEGTVFDPALDLLTPPLSPEMSCVTVTPREKNNFLDYDLALVKAEPEWDQMLPSDRIKLDMSEEDLFTYPLVDPSTMLPPDCKIDSDIELKILKDYDVMWSEDSHDMYETAHNLSLEHLYFKSDVSEFSEDQYDTDSSLPGALSDHSYSCSSKIKTAPTTPVESEDEIDVVTVEKIPMPIKFMLRPVCVTKMEQQSTPAVSHSKIPASTLVKQTNSKRPISSHVRINSSKRLKSHSVKSVSNLIVNVCDCKLSQCTKSKLKIPKELEDCCNETENKRTLHNNLERRRRSDMKSYLDSLRETIPALHNQQRAPKLVILKAAIKCIAELVRQEREFIKTRTEAVTEGEQLLKTLTRLEKRKKK